MKPRRWAWVLRLLLLVSLWVLFSPVTPDEAGAHGLDKVVHALLFGALALAAQRAHGFGLLLLRAYAGLSELLQALLPLGRDGGIGDLLADAAGALLAWRWAWLHAPVPAVRHLEG